MRIFAIADLHLCFGTPKKSMELFGPAWANYAERIKDNWQKKIEDQDLVLIPGDLSWAMKMQEALVDLQWIDQLPGVKVIVRGNHDYWWQSSAKLKENLPPSIHAVHNDVFNYQGVSIAGSRLWNSSEYNFSEYIDYKINPNAKEKIETDDEKVFRKELLRLKLSLDQLDQKAAIKICLTHFPPIGTALEQSKARLMMEQANVNFSVFGHLHNLKSKNLFGEKNNINYILCSADYIDFDPVEIKY